MIQTFTSRDTKEMDKLCNDFMRIKGKNLPVRTESFVIADAVWHKNTIFYDENLAGNKAPIELMQEEIHGEQAETEGNKQTHSENSNKIGALWLQKDGSVSGNINNERIVLPEGATEKVKELENGEKLEGNIKKTPAVIFRNKFKKTEKQPDWIIYKRED